MLLEPIFFFAVVEIALVVVLWRRHRFLAAIPIVVAAVFTDAGIASALALWWFGAIRTRRPSACIVPIALGVLYVAAQAELGLAAGSAAETGATATRFAIAYSAMATTLAVVAAASAVFRSRPVEA